LEKARITKSQAKALEHWLEKYAGGKEELIRTHVVGSTWIDDSEALNSMSLERLVVALYIGYEVERSPEEQVKELFDLHRGFKNHDYHRGAASGMQETLYALNIKIEGVNC
jgi:hypothetical protein